MSLWSYLKPSGAQDSDSNLLLPDPIQETSNAEGDNCGNTRVTLIWASS